jgi:hypothetical protein
MSNMSNKDRCFRTRIPHPESLAYARGSERSRDRQGAVGTTFHNVRRSIVPWDYKH